MTTYKLKLNQVRQILGLEVKLETAKLEDGTVVNYEKLESGYPIFAEDGVTPLAEGTYVLEDGTGISVDASGLIMEVTPPVETPAEEPKTEVEVVAKEEPKPTEEPKPAEEPKAEEPTDKEMMAKIQEDVKTCMEAVVALADEVAKMKDKLQMAEQRVNEFAKAPATTKIPKVSVPSDTKEDRMASTIDVIKQAMKK